MIEINLLPKDLRSKFILNKKLFIKLAFSILGVMLCLNLLLFLSINIKRHRLKVMEKKIAQAQPKINQLNQVKEELRLTKEKIESLEKDLEREIYWSKNLEKISASLPGGIWLKRLQLNEKSLIMEGSCFSLDDEMSLIGSFLSSLKQDVIFFRHFKEMELSSVSRRAIKELEVVDFFLTASLKE